MSRKRKGPAQSGQPKKRVLAPIVPESVPYENPAYIAQESQKAEIDPGVKGQPQTSLETSTVPPGGHSKPGPKRGRPSKLLPIEERLDLATEDFLLQVISGESISQSGSTGKRFLAPASLAVRTTAASLWISRRRPQLSQQAVAAVVESNVRVEDVTDRQLAQSVMRVLGRSDVIEVEKLAPKKLELVKPTGEATGKAGHGDGALPSCRIEEPLEPKNPAHGHKVEARNGSGAFLRWYGPEHGHGSKWNCFNSANICVGRTPRWPQAVELLMNTKPSTETIHPDPFELNEMGLEIADRRDQLAAQRSPRVLTRRRGR